MLTARIDKVQRIKAMGGRQANETENSAERGKEKTPEMDQTAAEEHTNEGNEMIGVIFTAA